MDYLVQKGDNLWNIAKNRYNLSDNADIANKVNEIAKYNNIEDANLIFDGQTIKFKSPQSDIFKLQGEVATPKEFNKWTNTLYPESEIQYAKQGATDEETAQNVLQASTEYINTFGKDGNIDFEAFLNVNKDLDTKSAQSIYSMIDMDKKGGITPDEHAAYMSVIDNADGKFDGNMNLDNYNTIGAEFPAFADELYDNSAYKGIHEKCKQGLEYTTKLMENFHDKFYSENK